MILRVLVNNEQVSLSLPLGHTDQLDLLDKHLKVKTVLENQVNRLLSLILEDKLDKPGVLILSCTLPVHFLKSLPPLLDLHILHWLLEPLISTCDDLLHSLEKEDLLWFLVSFVSQLDLYLPQVLLFEELNLHVVLFPRWSEEQLFLLEDVKHHEVLFVQLDVFLDLSGGPGNGLTGHYALELREWVVWD